MLSVDIYSGQKMKPRLILSSFIGHLIYEEATPKKEVSEFITALPEGPWLESKTSGRTPRSEMYDHDLAVGEESRLSQCRQYVQIVSDIRSDG